MTGPLAEGWITIEEAMNLAGYSPAYLRRLAHQGRVEARRIGQNRVFRKENLLAHKAHMEALGPEKHNPWRQDLVPQGRGRQHKDE